MRFTPGRATTWSHNATTLPQGRYEAALEDYDRAIALTPGHCRAVYNRAWAADQLGRADEALAGYGTSIRWEPGNPTAFHNRSRLLERLGRCGAAVLKLPPFENMARDAHGPPSEPGWTCLCV